MDPTTLTALAAGGTFGGLVVVLVALLKILGAPTRDAGERITAANARADDADERRRAADREYDAERRRRMAAEERLAATRRELVAAREQLAAVLAENERLRGIGGPP